MNEDHKGSGPEDLGLATLAGTGLGERTIGYDQRDAILYALAVGAPAERLDLVYERDLRTLPTIGTGLGLWAVEAAGELGLYDRARSLHVGQTLEVRKPFPREVSMPSSGRVSAVWDKGRATVIEIEVESELFRAGYTIFIPGLGGWGGERGPSGAPADEFEPVWSVERDVRPDAAALYRLTGDRHPVHIDPEVAAAGGFDRPILHGLATLGMAALEVADAADSHPADLTALDARFAAPVLPGESLKFRAGPVENGTVPFVVESGGGTVALKDGRASYA
ncbi:MAG: enoyl-CoA hydratase [Solirubrobacterales bacterium]|nr:enoyl-CoA hydratase [Solirubrobacterales bacterium]